MFFGSSGQFDCDLGPTELSELWSAARFGSMIMKCVKCWSLSFCSPMGTSDFTGESRENKNISQYMWHLDHVFLNFCEIPKQIFFLFSNFYNFKQNMFIADFTCWLCWQILLSTFFLSFINILSAFCFHVTGA